MEYFSDRELGKMQAINNEIEVGVWNGVVAIIEELINGNYFSKSFPKQCPDNLGIYGFNINLFNDKLDAIKIPLPLKKNHKHEISFSSERFTPITAKTPVNTYGALDLIEFCYKHIYEPVNVGDFHTYFNHFHLSFKDTGVVKNNFRREINYLFERNGIAYSLNEDGKIQRIVSEVFLPIIKRNYNTKDTDLNKLLSEATGLIILPKLSDRLRAVHVLWDSFERVKTFYEGSKKESVNKLILNIANKNELFEKHLQKEADELTKIGNTFQIRHFETGTQPIKDLSHIDYLFFRMLSLIDLFIKEVEK